MSILSKIWKRLFPPEIPAIPAGWRETAGRGALVCLIDGGAPRHQALAPSIDFDRSRSFVWGEGVEDGLGHATAMCGLILATAPEARVVCLKVVGKSGRGSATDIRLALEAASELDPDIVCCGAAVVAGASKMRPALRALAGRGTPVFAAVGNSRADGVMYPAKFDEAVGVGACTRTGRVARFSARGPEVDVLYPGIGLRSVGLSGEVSASGTCFASAVAAGVAALALSWLDATGAGGGRAARRARARELAIGAGVRP